jgi:formate-dependent nitrite reductase membrane component NrfD
MFLTPLAFLWAFVNLRIVFPKLNYDKFPFLYKVEDFVNKYKKPIAIALIPLALALGTYPGIMISAFNARPLWNNVMMGPLFMTYGITTGIATILLFAKTAKEIKFLNKILVLAIVILLSLIINYIMGYYAGNEMQLESIKIFMGGEMTTSFWGFVIALGLLVPLFIALLSLFEIKIPLKVAAILILIGGLIFRIVIVEAGQITRILY